NQLRVVDTPTGERWFYRYDPFGRRTGKRCEQTQDDIRYLWDGDQIAEVRHYRNGKRVARRHWVHNGWELLVQQRQNTDGRWETDFVTSSQNGEPQALYRPDGTLRWQAPKSTLWGQRPGSTKDSADPGLAFAGQYRDTESGLCYNRFRYYDPAGGCYVSPDPIGVLGGENNYGYVQNPNTWVDPLGLRKCSTGYKSADDAGRAALTKYNPMSIFKNREYGGIIFKAKDGSYGYTRGRLGSGRTAPTFKESSAGLPKGSTPVGQYHTHGDYSDINFNRTNRAGDMHSSDIFSRADIRIHNAADATFPGYTDVLGTPSGKFWKIFGQVSGPGDAIPL
ncbi:RHS repeat-associated core domain-containing protein, partial [Pectobacterium brasiliense]|uniref:RHS repeat-associated core domain-containing protein n=1 Tax=Pectobacterium brasiliense TaxID=180957 RepID=UPI0032EF1B77